MKPEKMHVPADLQELCDAFEDSSIDHRYYLDTETGEIIFISDEFMDTEEEEELNEKIEEGFGERRYILIPYADSHEGYEDIVDFIETVKDGNLKEKLYIAIKGRGAFRRFKDVLLSYPDERERWFKFKGAKVIDRVKEWLEDEGIEIVKVNPRQEFIESKEIEE